MKDCVTYGTTAQALADYAALVSALKREYAGLSAATAGRFGGAERAPVVAFGGSYGGMLAGWARVIRPDVN